MSPPAPSHALRIMRALGMEPDPWQLQVLDGEHRRLLLNCSRQAGKSTVVAVLSLMEAIRWPKSLILLLSRSFRQSTELFRLVTDFHARLGSHFLKSRTAHELNLTNQSRVVCLPCAEDTIRGYSGVTLVVIDEAARVPDDLYRAVRPMLAVSKGRMVCLSTPYGRRGFFYHAWAQGGADWTRIEVPARDIPRIAPEFLAEERRCLGDSYFRQEYDCSFEALEGLVYPDFARYVVPLPPSPRPSEGSSLLPSPRTRGEGSGVRGEPAASPSASPSIYLSPPGRRFGGIDFGFRNPFAAVWGTLDRDDVLWLTGEHYARQQPLSHHARHLPRDVTWYADPAGAGDISELRVAGFVVRKGDNDRQRGIAAVTARLRTARLRVLEGCCPNLLAEAALYRYADHEAGESSENPLDRDNHALAALRYLVLKLDTHKQAREIEPPDPKGNPPAAPPPAPRKRERKWLSIYNEQLWTRLT